MKKYEGKTVVLNDDGRPRYVAGVTASNIAELNRKFFEGAIVRFDCQQGKITKITGRWRVMDNNK